MQIVIPPPPFLRPDSHAIRPYDSNCNFYRRQKDVKVKRMTFAFRTHSCYRSAVNININVVGCYMWSTRNVRNARPVCHRFHVAHMLIQALVHQTDVCKTTEHTHQFGPNQQDIENNV